MAKSSLPSPHRGGSQRFADKADSFIRGGMQNGRKYCVNVVLNRDLMPTKVLGAYEKVRTIHTICGVRGGTAGNAWLIDGNSIVTLAVQGRSQRGLELVDRYIRGGTQNGTYYCVNGSTNREGQLISAVGAFKMP